MVVDRGGPPVDASGKDLVLPHQGRIRGWRAWSAGPWQRVWQIEVAGDPGGSLVAVAA
jgi:hypothetical protein